MLPIFRWDIDEFGETRVEANALVDVPAHMKAFISFGKKQTPTAYQFNEEKRMVTGVMMSANTPIYRNDPNFGEYYGYFSPQVIDKIRRKFMMENRQHLVNEMHDPSKSIKKGIYMIDSYAIGGDKNPKAPEAFKTMNLQDGSWISSYYIADDTIWNKVKSGEFAGFSVEGIFDVYESEVRRAFNKQKSKINMSQKRKTISELLGFGVKQKFAEGTTSDGVVLMWEGELSADTAVFIEADGAQVPAPEGSHEVTLEDGTVKIIQVDANGVVTSVSELDEEVDFTEEVAEAMQKLEAKFSQEVVDALKPITEQLAKVQKELATLKGEKESKFKQDPKKTGAGTQKMSASDLLRNKK